MEYSSDGHIQKLERGETEKKIFEQQWLLKMKFLPVVNKF